MIDITGQRFGRLLALRFIEKRGHGNPFWLFKCDCGNEKIIRWYSVKCGDTKSCGCIHREKMSELLSTHKFTIDEERYRFYTIWRNMKMRCFRLHDYAYRWYGQRGITVCSRWMKFENFRNDMYARYCEHLKTYGEKNTTLDRIDNDGNYALENCRWATMKEQANHTRGNHYIEWNGEIKSLSQWCDSLRLSYSKVGQRINKLRWPIEKAFTN